MSAYNTLFLSISFLAISLLHPLNADCEVATFNAHDLGVHKGFAVDTEDNLIYHHEQRQRFIAENQGQIIVSRLDDGTQVNLIETGLHFVHAVAVDQLSDRIFWLGLGTHNGALRNILYSSSLSASDPSTAEYLIDTLPTSPGNLAISKMGFDEQARVFYLVIDQYLVFAKIDIHGRPTDEFQVLKWQQRADRATGLTFFELEDGQYNILYVGLEAGLQLIENVTTTAFSPDFHTQVISSPSVRELLSFDEIKSESPFPLAQQFNSLLDVIVDRNTSKLHIAELQSFRTGAHSINSISFDISLNGYDVESDSREATTLLSSNTLNTVELLEAYTVYKSLSPILGVTFSNPEQCSEINSINIEFNETETPEDTEEVLPKLALYFVDHQGNSGRHPISPESLSIEDSEVSLSFPTGLPYSSAAFRLAYNGSHLASFTQHLGDFNCDGGTSIHDFSVFASSFGLPTSSSGSVGEDGRVAPDYVDLDKDGDVDIFDFELFKRHFGELAPSWI